MVGRPLPLGHTVMESHQASKLDTSGTAKAVVSCFKKLGVSFELDQIQKIREAKQQVEMVGVPEEYLSGHAFHIVSFEFQHNVCGRSIYAEGTVDAAIFLAKKVESKADKRIYNMIDVLREDNGFLCTAARALNKSNSSFRNMEAKTTEDRRPRRLSVKTHHPNWKEKEFMESAFRDIVSDELQKIKDSSLNDYLDISTSATQVNDELWEYDGLHTASQDECEEIMIEMQRIFYEDLRVEPTSREPEGNVGTWEDEEDDYLAGLVFEHMQLNDDQVQIQAKTIFLFYSFLSPQIVCKKETWCPICKRGELRENHNRIYCTLCKFQLNRGDEVNLDFLRVRLGEAHTEHLDRGCRLTPKCCMETIFNLTALYIQCEACNTFEIVL
ncbi:hypothetical protein HHK36_021974 [Tetracentron sinense]|uniref:Uncharacterized protein n=1 Tax=Tetracentron sinense TaxID=13715 RepID=A0A834YRA0_TETSI|nr:hypothetical protein HHK36_021974 [Tetracentron sinense]